MDGGVATKQTVERSSTAAVTVLAATALKSEVPGKMLGACEEAARMGSVAIIGW